MKEINAEEFLKPYYRENYSYNCYSEEDIVKAMNAFALHVLEIFERDIDAYDEANLKPFFEEIKKELNGETETRQTYPCKVCGKPFGDKLSLYNHYNEEHNRDF